MSQEILEELIAFLIWIILIVATQYYINRRGTLPVKKSLAIVAVSLLVSILVQLQIKSVVKGYAILALLPIIITIGVSAAMRKLNQ